MERAPPQHGLSYAHACPKHSQRETSAEHTVYHASTAAPAPSVPGKIPSHLHAASHRGNYVLIPNRLKLHTSSPLLQPRYVRGLWDLQLLTTRSAALSVEGHRTSRALYWQAMSKPLRADSGASHQPLQSVNIGVGSRHVDCKRTAETVAVEIDSGYTSNAAQVLCKIGSISRREGNDRLRSLPVSLHPAKRRFHRSAACCCM